MNLKKIDTVIKGSPQYNMEDMPIRDIITAQQLLNIEKEYIIQKKLEKKSKAILQKSRF